MKLPFKPSRRTVLTLLSIGVLTVVGAVLFLRQSSPDDGFGGRTESLTTSVEVPSETPITGDYSVPNGQPLSIEIAARGIKGNLQKVGIDQHKAVAAPNNVNLAGWFSDSALPGRKGLSIIDGHVSGVSRHGVFYNLNKVAAGDKVVITYGDKTTRTYTAFATRAVATNEAQNYLFDQDPRVTEQLNIITCGGRYNSATKGYEKRVIVSAKLESV